jgi:hypothetical protein
MEKEICETLSNTQVSNIESFFMLCFPSCIVMASSSLTHHLCISVTLLLLVPQTTDTIAREKWGITRLSHACQEASANVGPQKALNVVAMWLPSHGSFKEVTQIHNNGIFSHSSSL